MVDDGKIIENKKVVITIELTKPYKTLTELKKIQCGSIALVNVINRRYDVENFLMTTRIDVGSFDDSLLLENTNENSDIPEGTLESRIIEFLKENGKATTEEISGCLIAEGIRTRSVNPEGLINAVIYKLKREDKILKNVDNTWKVNNILNKERRITNGVIS